MIRHVLLVKKGTSKNGRLYTEAVLGKAKSLYEGAAVYGDHPSGRGYRSRRDQIGWLSGVYLGSAGLRAERLNHLTTHPLVPPIMEAAWRNPKLFGLSHNITGDVQRKSGVDEVTVIEAVNSVDVVSQRSTTSGLQESTQRPRLSASATWS